MSDPIKTPVPKDAPRNETRKVTATFEVELVNGQQAPYLIAETKRGISKAFEGVLTDRPIDVVVLLP